MKSLVVCALAAVTSTSRMIYAFARDDGLPFSKALKSVSHAHRTPVAAIWFTAFFSVAAILYTPAFAALSAASAVFLYISYAMPIAAGLVAEANWIKTRRRSGLFVDPDADVQKAMNTVADYVMGNYEQQHAGHFLSGADPWLIAHAMYNKGIVVTHESAKRPQAKAARIPDVCDALKVPCIDTYEMLDRLGADFKPGAQKKSE